MKIPKKFRVWNGFEMVYEPMVSMISTASINEWFQDREDVMQYIGFKDKNGKEIFEDDLVLLNGIIYIVPPIEDCFLTNNIGDELTYKNHRGICEVIGNKFENPELYEANQD